MRAPLLHICYIVLCIVFSWIHKNGYAKNNTGSLYQELSFSGNHITYNGQKINLGTHAFFIDGSLSVQEAAKYKYVFNSINEASKHLSNGSEKQPMVLYIAPWVYWLDNPDDLEERIPQKGQSVPFGLEMNCDWLTFMGLSDNPKHVILACNRGQTMGAKGNFTMLNIKGDGICAENVTFGNYCNIDLVYPLQPELNRKKRGNAIVQAQLIFSDGDKVVARNTHFISRLNLSPFWGSKRTLFDRCHFESTDDALNGRAVYLNCTFDIYSSKPFYRTDGTGAVFLNCDIHAFTRGKQYFTKAGGQIAIVDTRLLTSSTNYWGWQKNPTLNARNYQYKNIFNQETVFMDSVHPYATVEMTGKDVLNAYRFNLNDTVIYNTYNLLRGEDDWDPMFIKPLVERAENQTGMNLTTQPTQLTIHPIQKKLETEKDSVLLVATAYRFGNFEVSGEKIKWSIDQKYNDIVKIDNRAEGTCLVIPINHNDETREVVIKAHTTSGLEAATALQITPSFLVPPTFKTSPTLSNPHDGKLYLSYVLNMIYEDQSLISWYRCEDASGSKPIEVFVSRYAVPLTSYPLSKADIGFYIMAKIRPKHVRCNPGEIQSIISNKPIQPNDIKQRQHFYTPDLMHMSTKYQPIIKPGFWTLDSYAPADTKAYNWEPDNSKDPWYFGRGVNGAANDSGLVQATKGARLRYTPIGEKFGDMSIQFTAVPAKTAGQGFSSARAQYMDIGIKMDTKQMTGYALRLIRTVKYSNAIDFILMKYKNGNATPISEAISASCYQPNCRITVSVKGNKLLVSAVNIFDSYFSTHDPAEVKRVVEMVAEIETLPYGGVSFQHTGSVGSGATLIKDLKIKWK